MLAMFATREYDNWDDLLPFMMLAYNTTVHTSTGFTPHRLVFGEECNLPGNLVHRELRPDPPPRDIGDYASWIKQALYEAYDEVRAQQQRATHGQKRNYDRKAVARTFPIGCWVLRYYPPARKYKLCSPWIGPYKVVRAPMEWVVGIQVCAPRSHVKLTRCGARHFNSTQHARTIHSRANNSRPNTHRIR